MERGDRLRERGRAYTRGNTVADGATDAEQRGRLDGEARCEVHLAEGGCHTEADASHT